MIEQLGSSPTTPDYVFEALESLSGLKRMTE